MPDHTWRWIEDLPDDSCARVEAAFNAIIDLKGWQAMNFDSQWAAFATFLRDSDLLSDTTLYSQAAAYVVVAYGAIVQEHFVNFMYEHFGGEFHEAPVKKLPRIFTKMTEDEPRLADEATAAEDPQIRCAYFMLGDAVRGSIRAEGANEMVQTIEKLQAMKKMSTYGKFEVWRIKNTHHADAEDMTGGYRDVKVLGRFTARRQRVGSPISMIVEIQVIDSVYMEIKKFMHKAYAIDRGDFDEAGATERGQVPAGATE
jgi:hypothetical protein